MSNRYLLPEDYEPREFTQEMEQELTRLSALLGAGNNGPDFPWAKYDDLTARKSLFGSNESMPSQKSYIRPNTASSFESISSFQPKNLASKAGKRTFFGIQLPDRVRPHNTEEAPTKPKKPAAPPPALESLCKGKDVTQRNEVAKKFDAMWSDVKSNIVESEYNTACTAVFKVAQWLGMIHNDTKSREWKAMLLERYGVCVSEALGKYKIESPPQSKIFRKAVIASYAFAQKNMAIRAKQHPLPAIYQ